ncbi:hypothetical protein RRF57_008866 [Xylaria bambusicola]|uniref:Uncharacterized protein n=1 Tax=Xylaria bambusicola TaxID=326684 RepID=A0AAN7Z7D9_9PEZI
MSAHGSSNTGSKTSTGMASSTTTPANAGLGGDKPKAFDAEGTIGKQFTGKSTNLNIDQFPLQVGTYSSAHTNIIATQKKAHLAAQHRRSVAR